MFRHAGSIEIKRENNSSILFATISIPIRHSFCKFIFYESSSTNQSYSRTHTIENRGGWTEDACDSQRSAHGHQSSSSDDDTRCIGISESEKFRNSVLRFLPHSCEWSKNSGSEARLMGDMRKCIHSGIYFFLGPEFFAVGGIGVSSSIASAPAVKSRIRA